MSLETAQYLHQLNPANPSGADRLQQGDDHLRLLKAVLKATFPGFAGPLDASVSDTFLNGLAAQTVPTGAIMLWSGADSAVPTGWAICNGQQVTASDGTTKITTPDLRDRVVSGASDTHAVLSTFGAATSTGNTSANGAHDHTVTVAASGAHDHGAATGGHTLTIAEMPSHNHGNGVGNETDGSIFVYGSKSGNSVHQPADGNGSGTVQGLTETIGGDGSHTHPITAAGDHTHTASTSMSATHGHTVTVDIIPPTIALHYIIKV